MSDNANEMEEDFKSQNKYKQFASSVERALRAFELSTEWHDLISSLAKLNKVLLAYAQFPVVPHQCTVSKRLSQCLHPNLPSGVHIKTLDVYRAIFDRIKHTGLSENLLLYSSGLYPLFGYGSMSVRSQLLDIYEKYYATLGSDVKPGVHGLVLGLLPGLEDESEHTERINCLFETLCTSVDLPCFSSVLWMCVLSSPDVRLPAANVILSKLNKKLTAEDQVHLLGDNLSLVVAAICSALVDKTVLTNRSLLDIVTYLFPFHQPFLLHSDYIAIVIAALDTLLKRDMSLNRRLISWLLGTNVDKSSSPHPTQSLTSDLPTVNKQVSGLRYFEAHSKNYAVSAIRQLCKQAMSAVKSHLPSRVDCVRPYRLMRILVEQSQISQSLTQSVLLNIVSTLKEQITSLGGWSSTQSQELGVSKMRRAQLDDLPKRVGKKSALKIEILQSANLFFNSLECGFLWVWLGRLLTAAYDKRRSSECGHTGRQSKGAQEEEEHGLEEPESVHRSMDSPVPTNSVPSQVSTVSTTFEPIHSVGECSLENSSQRRNSMDPTSVIGLTKFLLQCLPLDSIENAHLVHIPQLCVTMVTALLKTHHFLTASEIQQTLDLISFVIHELNLSPSSQATTPSTPLPSLKSGQAAGSSADAAYDNAESADRSFPVNITYDIIKLYLEFFSGFIKDRVVEQRESRHSNSHNSSPFLKACQLLSLLASFGKDKKVPVDRQAAEGSSTRELPAWLTRLLSACTDNWVSHDHHVTYVAMDTVLTILGMHREQMYSERSETFEGVSCSRSLITSAVFNFVTSNQKFVQVAADCLWSCLSPSQSSCHMEAATLLSLLLTQLTPSSVCEMVILEHFSRDGLEAYQSFTVLWKYSPLAGRQLSRAILRMLEGLQSESASVRLLVTSWVNFALSHEEDLQVLILPLLRILLVPNAFRQSIQALEPNPLFIGCGLSADDADKDLSYAKYYYATLGIPDPRDLSNRSQLKENLLHYSRLYDAKQVLYALSLLQRVVDVDPPLVINCMSSVLVDPLSYTGAHYRQETAASSGVRDTPTSTHPLGDMSPLRDTPISAHPLGDTPISAHPLGETPISAHPLGDTPVSAHPLGDTPISAHPLGDTPILRPPVKDPLPIIAQQSLLEITFSSSLHFLLSDYPLNVEAALPNHLDNVLVKIASTDLVCTLLFQLTESLGSVQRAQAHGSESGAKGKRRIDNPSFVSALTTLCDVHKTILLALGAVVQDLRSMCPSSMPAAPRGDNDGSVWVGLVKDDLLTSGGDGPVSQCQDPEVCLTSFFTHLLLSIQGLVALEAQCACMQENIAMEPKASSLSSGVRTSEGDMLPALLPNVPTVSQPFYQSLVLDLLSDSTLSHLHETLLNLFLSTLPNMLSQQLYELAPKVIKQLCKNLEPPSPQDKKFEATGSGCIMENKLDRKQCVLYLNSLCSVVCWCLHGEHQPSLSDRPCCHVSLNPFWRKLRVKDVEEQNETLSPSSRQPSTMSWLFSVFTHPSSTGKPLISDDQCNPNKQNLFSSSRVGISSRVGQHTLMLLPAVYNAIIEVWRECGHGSGSESIERGREVDASGTRLVKMGTQNVWQLISRLLSNLAVKETSAFFSSISHIWMEWNLETKVHAHHRLAKRKEIFIDLLHKIKILPLSKVIDCIQSTMADIALVEEKESILLKQKFLLHFLYKYISSAQQGSEELADCSGQVVSFLRDFYNLSFIPTHDYLINNCHILCMLTSILHVVVCRVPPPDPKKQRKERKDLQDLVHKLCEALSMAADVGLFQDDYILVEEGKVQDIQSKEPASPLPQGDVQDCCEPPPAEPRTDSDHETEDSGEECRQEDPVSEGDVKLTPDSITSSSMKPMPVIDTSPSGYSEHGRLERLSDSKESEECQSAPVNHSNIETVAPKPSMEPTHPLSSKVSRSGTSREGLLRDLKSPTIQALAVLSNVLSHFVDCTFEGTEKDKVISLLKAVLCNIWPHLQNYSPETQQNYAYSVKLLSSLSGFQVGRKAWRKEAFDFFLSQAFFKIEVASLREWKTVVDNLMTQDDVTFRDILSQLHTSTSSGVANIFSSVEQEVMGGARLLKRMAFAILSAEMDQFVQFLPSIQEKLSEYLRVLRYPRICAMVMLVFRVILLRFSSTHLMAFWPTITFEMLTLLAQLDNELCVVLSEDSTQLSIAKLELYYSVCKLLDTAMSLPAEYLPHFQLLRWGFTDQEANSNRFVISKLCRHFQELDGSSLNSYHSSHSITTGSPHLQSTSISSLRELKPFFVSLSDQSRGLSHLTSQQSVDTPLSSHFSLVREQEDRLELVEEILLRDFVEVATPS